MGVPQIMQRDTPQRQAIRQILEDAKRPMSPQEVLDAAHTRYPRLGIATVYRTLKLLTGEGWLMPLELPGEAARFERAGKRHAYYFCCRVCHSIYDFEGCVLKPDLALPEGYRVEDHKVILYGRCPKCQGEH